MRNVTRSKLMTEDGLHSVNEAARVLVVDDEPAVRQMMARLLQRQRYEVTTAADGESAFRAVRRNRPDVILLDVQMRGLSGFEICRRLKAHPETRLIPVVLVTGLHGREDRIQGISAGADDVLSKPVDPQELYARVASLVRCKQFTDELDSAQGVIVTLALTIEGRDPYTNGHCQRVARYATVLGASLRLPDGLLAAVRSGGFLHDLGKIAVPDAILLKAGRLTDDERRLMQQHPVVGDHLCSGLRSLQDVRPIIRSHHERYDGSGYPDGLIGDDIPLGAQILSVADAYDAMTTTRPYKNAISGDDAIEELWEDVRRGWRRPDLVSAFAVASTQGMLNVETESANAQVVNQPADVPSICAMADAA